MKIKPQIYAQTLIQSAQNDNLKKIARNFWYKLQKNKQYKDLPKILDMIDLESAKSQNKILAKVYSENELTISETQTIQTNLEKKLQKAVIIKNIIKKNVTGFIIKIDNKIFDLSLEGRLDKLKKKLKME